MSALLVIAGAINDPEKWAAYRSAVLPLIQRFGGTHMTRSGASQVLEGACNTIAMFEFPSMNELRSFWESSEYISVKELRRDAADLTIWAVVTV